jgi:membrane-associated phospholipid phosphatase
MLSMHGFLRGLCPSLFLCSGTLLAQELPTPAQVWKSTAGAWQQLEQPTLITVALLPALVALDRPIEAGWQCSPAADAVFEVARLYGERWTPVVLAAGLYGAGWLMQDRRLRRVGLAIAGGAGIAALLVTGVKVAVGRARPSVGAGSLAFSAPGWDDLHQSFPSGHSALAFLMSTIVASSFQLPPAVRAFVYGGATLTAVSRLYHRRHWLSDVVAGALVGWVVGQTMVGVFVSPQFSAGVELVPVPSGVGIRVPLR